MEDDLLAHLVEVGGGRLVWLRRRSRQLFTFQLRKNTSIQNDAPYIQMNVYQRTTGQKINKTRVIHTFLSKCTDALGGCRNPSKFQRKMTLEEEKKNRFNIKEVVSKQQELSMTNI